jgi:type II secretory pathway component GspD/PulD (secretin)
MATIDKLDTATKQVLIEARLFETARKPQTLKGINWSGTAEAQQFTFGNNQYVPGSDRSVNSLVTPTLPKLLADTAKGFNPATAFLNADGVSAVISFLNKDNESDLLATPRAAQDVDVSVLANDIETTQTAEIGLMRQMLAEQ